MNTESVTFIKDHVLLLQEKYNESLAKISDTPTQTQDKGRWDDGISKTRKYQKLDWIKVLRHRGLGDFGERD